MNNEQKLVPELRFPEFRSQGEWKLNKVENLVSIVSPPKKLLTSEFKKDGKFPIIDQSQDFYCGKTNDIDAVVFDNLPLVIFGDHTCVTKLANKPFAQGADGIKILKSNTDLIKPDFLFQQLQYNNVKQEHYKRHYSLLKEKRVSYPKVETGEQQKIAACLSSLDELISAHQDKLEALKAHKKGLMQNLFPKEGQSVPDYRFPEFEGDGEWVEKTLGDVAVFLKGKGISKADVVENGKIPCIRYGELYTHYNETINIIRSSTNVKIEDLVFSEINDVIIPASGETQIDIATAACVLVRGVALGGDLNIIRSEINGVFLSYYLNNVKKESIARLAQGMQVIHLYNSQLQTLLLNIPTREEQNKIAACLSTLEEHITTQTEKIAQLQLHRKGLMQKLFPAVN